MSEPARYSWIRKTPIRDRCLPPVKPSSAPTLLCDRCGCESKGRRKKCPACFARLETT